MTTGRINQVRTLTTSNVNLRAGTSSKAAAAKDHTLFFSLPVTLVLCCDTGEEKEEGVGLG